jgi:hypothetical protein
MGSADRSETTRKSLCNHFVIEGPTYAFVWPPTIVHTSQPTPLIFQGRQQVQGLVIGYEGVELHAIFLLELP